MQVPGKLKTNDLNSEYLDIKLPAKFLHYPIYICEKFDTDECYMINKPWATTRAFTHQCRNITYTDYTMDLYLTYKGKDLFRLRGSSPERKEFTKGILEIYFNNLWYLVYNNIGSTEAAIACKSFGFKSSMILDNYQFPHDYSISIVSLRCNISARNLDDCQKTFKSSLFWKDQHFSQVLLYCSNEYHDEALGIFFLSKLNILYYIVRV